MEKLKDNIHIIVAVNSILVLMIFFTVVAGGSSSTSKTIIVDGRSKEHKDHSLKDLICREAFNNWRNGTLSSFYMHPEIIKNINDGVFESFRPSEVREFYFKIIGRDTCKTVVKLQNGFITFDSVVGRDGPLYFRITSLKLKKPEIEDIKEYL